MSNNKSAVAKPSVPQGTRDFGPDVVRKRQYILSTIKSVFELYGFQPLETPAMENLETLMGKYGEEGDKLIFRILDSGNPFQVEFLQEFLRYFIKFRDDIVTANPEFENWKSFEFLKNLAESESVVESLAKKLQNDKEVGKLYLNPFKKEISSKALRYDLTIPFARYVAMNHGQLTFPFKRYQIQPVWRADRPQKGRYREFYQCDVDVVGSNSLINEVEFVNIYHQALTKLGIKGYELRINSRKILSALAELSGGADKMMDITIAIDKLDKIGLDKVKDELAQRGLSEDQISTIEQYLKIDGSNDEKLTAIKSLFKNNETGQKGIEEIEFVMQSTADANINLIVDFTLARGLNYYTGIIFEAKAPAEVKIGSIGGGGRYDDLTGLFGVPNIPGAGISFGVDRIYDVMEEMNLFPQTVAQGTKVLFFNLGEAESKKAYSVLQQLRSKGVASELFHEATKMDKQFKYAEKKAIPFVVIMGSREIEANNCVLKNIATGEQQTLSTDELLNYAFND